MPLFGCPRDTDLPRKRPIQESESLDHRHLPAASQTKRDPNRGGFSVWHVDWAVGARAKIATPFVTVPGAFGAPISEGRAPVMELDDILVILLAGGAGERLYPLTKERAKPAVYFGGPYRIIDFTLSNCINSGLRRVFIATQYKSLSLNRHLRTGWNVVSEALGEFIEILPPQMPTGQHWYQGPADGVYQNLYSIIRERPRYLVVLAGDHVYKMDYQKMLR